MSRFIFFGHRYPEEEKLIQYQSSSNECVNVPLLNNDTLSFGIQNAYCETARFGIEPNRLGLDILTLALLVYLADIKVPRLDHSQDSWAREIVIVCPVSDSLKWNACVEIIEKQLTFLTGDIWKIHFYEDDFVFDTGCLNIRQQIHPEFDTIALFSGGLDSLVFSLDTLDAGKNLLFVSHADSSLIKSTQRALLDVLSQEYSENYGQVNLWTSFPEDLIHLSSSENTTRSRSFLFIAYALFSASGLPSVKEINVPENGFIALNVPLDSLRLGSHSTRTTHPHYFSLWNQLLLNLGVDVSIVNCYWNCTKGEMLQNCTNKALLEKLLPLSMSCSSPTKYRWRGLPPQHCGHCVPCIIRRASVHHSFGDDSTDYVYNNLNIVDRMHADTVGEHLRSFKIAIAELQRYPGSEYTKVLMSGPLHGEEIYKNELAGVYSRGLNEVSNVIEWDKKCSI